jgi:hypothetical protein
MGSILVALKIKLCSGGVLYVRGELVSLSVDVKVAEGLAHIFDF